eukprot:NODE_1341_length_956_cov_229.144432_g1034_i0.p1 GENE.NODE_1341_length_956_cov_229.144432_g1034_i0~~NODE_1341_length_956_cov_229.144432_g1034_i0.p1  ORF type:complete len:216 (-),score=39.17 NODE_1341_length_956_cov_229.144432_g1034_i0:247-894(-)
MARACVYYAMDPTDGWCYASSESMAAIHRKYKDAVDFQLFVAGICVGSGTKKNDSQLATKIRRIDGQVARVTGVVFSDSYQEQIVDNEAHIFDGELACLAIEAINRLRPEKAFEFAGLVQRAQFVEGKRLQDPDIYSELVRTCIPDLDLEIFTEMVNSEEHRCATHQRFAAVRSMNISCLPAILALRPGHKPALGQGYMPPEKLEKRIQRMLEHQ